MYESGHWHKRLARITFLLPLPLPISLTPYRQNSGLMMLRYLVGLLGRNSHIIFNIVSQMGVPQRILFLLLKESGIYQMNVLEVGGYCSMSMVVPFLNSVLLSSLQLLLLVLHLVLTIFYLFLFSGAYCLSLYLSCLPFLFSKSLDFCSWLYTVA